MNIKRVFTVDGKPFFPLGGQAHNSSGYNDAESEAAFEAVKLLHGNMLEIPVYWDQIEPVERRFDFASVDALLAGAVRHGLKLVLLWFGTWKNGDMDYAPGWVKTNPRRFKRVTTPTGKDAWVLSSHCAANLEADRAAFVALCQYIAAHDSGRAVIALQIENEPGILGSDRDYGPEAQSTFDAPVPADLMGKLKAAGKGRLRELWQQAGARPAGSWPEVFGWAAGELMTAWSIARYIDGLAEAGKAACDLPMYVNVWLGEHGWAIPGETYPSGGAVGKVLDIYKWFTPHVDLIAPDIYIADARGYEAECALYARADNPLFVPESAPGSSNPWLMFRAIGDYGAIGYSLFGVEHVMAPDGSIRPETQQIVDSFRCAAAAITLLLQHQGTGHIHAVAQEEHVGAQQLALDGYLGLAEFGEAAQEVQDWRHPSKWRRTLTGESTPSGRGRGLVFQTGPHEFYLAGADYRLVLRPRLSPQQSLDLTVAGNFLLLRQVHYVSVEEGHFDVEGRFVIDRRRNGDEVDGGVWVAPDVGVVRVVVCE